MVTTDNLCCLNVWMVAVLLPACFATLISLKETPTLLIHLWTGLFSAAITTSKQWTPHCQLNSHQHIVHGQRAGRRGYPVLPSCTGVCWSSFKNDWQRQSPIVHTGTNTLPHFPAVNNTTLMAGQWCSVDAETTTMWALFKNQTTTIQQQTPTA